MFPPIVFLVYGGSGCGVLHSKPPILRASNPGPIETLVPPVPSLSAPENELQQQFDEGKAKAQTGRQTGRQSEGGGRGKAGFVLSQK